MEISLISGLMERNYDETNSDWKYGWGVGLGFVNCRIGSL